MWDKDVRDYIAAGGAAMTAHTLKMIAVEMLPASTDPAFVHALRACATYDAMKLTLKNEIVFRTEFSGDHMTPTPPWTRARCGR